MARGFYGRTGIQIKDDLSGNLEFLKSYVQEAAVAAVVRGAKIVQERAKEIAPVSPGLRGHGTDGSHMVDHIDVEIYHDPPGANARVGVFRTDIIPYAAHVEFGVNGRPFLRPAVDETREEVHQAMAEEFGQQLAEGFDVRTAVRFRGVA